MTDRERILNSIRDSLTGDSGLGTGDSGPSAPLRERGAKEQATDASMLDKAIEMIRVVGGAVLEKGSDAFSNWKPESDSLTIQGEFLVAENGAIWVEPSADMERSSIFLAEHLVIEVPKNEVVSNMHEAYEQIKGRNFSYGTFISGPSKTADIEQSLVIGAQGPKSCVVVLI